QEAQGQHHGGLGREQRRPRVQGWKAFPATRQIPLHQRGRAREFQGASPRPYWRVQNPRPCDIPRNSCIRRTGGFGSSWNGESGTCRTRPCTRLKPALLCSSTWVGLLVNNAYLLKEQKHFKCWSNSWKYARVATSFTSF